MLKALEQSHLDISLRLTSCLPHQVPIVISWFTSPLLSGLAAAMLFLVVRTAILRREHSLQLAFWVRRAMGAYSCRPSQRSAALWASGRPLEPGRSRSRLHRSRVSAARA